MKFSISHIVYLLGLLGAVLFFIFRPSVDYYSEAPLDFNRKDVETKINTLSTNLGVQLDTLSTITTLQQHTKYAEAQMDSSLYPNPKALNQKDQVLSSWDVVYAPIQAYNSIPINANEFFTPWALFGFESMIMVMLFVLPSTQVVQTQHLFQVVILEILLSEY